MAKQKVELSPANLIKNTIIERTVKEDQTAVATQWVDTFRHNAKDNAATNIAKLMIAAIAKGDFKTKSALASPDLTAPPNTLSVVDYVSHASRIIIDYEKLNPDNLQEFLALFPESGQKGVVARSATHAVVRKGEKITELKGFMLGVTGQLPTIVKTPYDFGLNIAMGGEGQKNHVGNTISANGFSGHMYFHHYAPDSLLMLGLEQSAPAASILEAIWGHSSPGDGAQHDSDQFGQGHSLTGASDTYTAAGSLYFSDPIYQAKLLAETGSLPPDKYGAMQVTLTDDNWAEIKKFLVALDTNLDTTRYDLVFNQLLAPPQTATDTPQTIHGYIAVDFKAYLKGIAILLEQVPEEKRTAVKEKIDALQMELLTCIKGLQEGETKHYKRFQEIVQAICELEELPLGYGKAIQRVQHLFSLQHKIDPKLVQTHINILIEQRCSELLDAITALEEKAAMLREYFSSEHISQENGVGLFMHQLQSSSAGVDKIKHLIMMDAKPIVLGIEEDAEEDKDSLSNIIVKQRSLESSWLEVAPLSLEDLALYQDEIQRFDQFLKATPRLVSESSLLKAKTVISEQLIALQTQEKDLSILQLRLETQVREASQQGAELESTKKSLQQVKDELVLLQQQLKLEQQAASLKISEHLQTIETMGTESSETIRKLRSQIEIEATRHEKTEKELRLKMGSLELNRDELTYSLQQQAKVVEQQQLTIISITRELEKITLAQEQASSALNKLKLESGTEKEQLQSAIAIQKRKAETAEASLSKLQKEVDHLREDNERLKEESVLLQSAAQGLSERADRLELQLKSKSQEALEQALQIVEVSSLLSQAKSKHESDVGSLTHELEKSAKKVVELTRQGQTADKENKHVLSELQSQLRTEKQRHDSIEKQLRHEMEQFRSQQSSLYSASQKKIIKLQKDIDTLRHDNEQLSIQVKESSKLPAEERERLHSQLQSQRQKLGVAEELASSLNDKVEQLQTENQRLNKEVKRLSGELSSLESQLFRKTQEALDNESALDLAKKALLQATREFDEIHETYDFELSKARAKIEELTKLSDEASKSNVSGISELQRQLQKAVEKYQGLEGQYRSETEQLRAKLEKASDLHQRKVLQLEASLEQLQLDFSQLQEQLETSRSLSKSEREQFQREMDSQAEKLAVALKCVDDGKRELEQVKKMEARHQETIERLENRIRELQTERTATSKAAEKQALINLAPVFMQIKNVEEQAKLLLNRGFTKEYNLALQLAGNIRKDIDTYLTHVDKPTKQTALTQLKINSERHIEDVTSVLEVHRGWAQLLGNLAACVAGLGLGYVVAVVINKLATGQYLFFNQTESMRTVNGLQESLNELESVATQITVGGY